MAALPERFGTYQVLSELGAGGMGKVYLARDPALGREVAIKTLAPGRTGSPMAWERLLREARAAARLRHPNVVQIHAFESAGDPPWLVMERVRGPSLQELLSSAPRDRLLQLLATVARAVQAAHDQGIVHRDLKPGNVLVEAESGRPLVADFGLALELEEADDPGERLTRSGVVLGTVEYMAPEQAFGRREEQGPPTDVWALGVMLYRVLTGRLPFGGVSPVEVLLQATRAQPVPPSRLAAVPPALEALCLRAISRDPSARPTASAFANELERELVRAGAVTSEGPGAPATPPDQAVTRSADPAAPRPVAAAPPRGRHPLALALPLLFLLLLGVAVTIGLLEQRLPAPGPGPRLPAPAPARPPPASEATLADDPFLRSRGTWGQPFPDQWSLPAIGLGTDLGGPRWPRPRTPVVVAIVDTGIDWSHPELLGRAWVNPREVPGNDRDDDGCGLVDDVHGWNYGGSLLLGLPGENGDDVGRGTHLAGLIGAIPGNGRGIAGVNPDVRLMSVRVAGAERSASRPDRLALGIEYAVQHGARVVLVGPGSDSFGSPYMGRALQVAAGKGALVVVPLSQYGWLLGEAPLGQVLLVGATRVDGSLLEGRGPDVHLVAPGEELLSLRPQKTPGRPLGPEGRYAILSGSEPAAALVAGAAALVLGARPDLTAVEVRRVLLQSARPLPWGGDAGYGMLDVPAALAADPTRWIEAELSAANDSGDLVLFDGTADADQFGRAWLEVGAGERPTTWERLPDLIASPVRRSNLGMVLTSRARTLGKVLTVRLTVEDAAGRQRTDLLSFTPPEHR